MNILNNFETVGNIYKASRFLESLKTDRFLFSLVLSYTQTCEIPGITFAGADSNLIQFTPPADAEYLHYGYCKTINKIPMTPDGIPTPALLTKIALESSSIPHIVINAGSKVSPQLPFIESGLTFGKNIYVESAMSSSQVVQAVDYGRIVGRSLASITDCLVIGESIPGGTTTALAVLKGLGFDARVSSSIPNNPLTLKNQVVSSALTRLDSDSPYNVVASVGDPMIAFVAGMLSSASEISHVLLAGGTQMAAVLAFATKLGFNEDNTAVGTTSYIINDNSANFKTLISKITNVPAFAVDPGLQNSKFVGLKSFSEGFAKEGAGAGGSLVASILKKQNSSNFLELAEREYARLFKV